MADNFGWVTCDSLSTGENRLSQYGVDEGMADGYRAEVFETTTGVFSKWVFDTSCTEETGDNVQKPESGIGAWRRAISELDTSYSISDDIIITGDVYGGEISDVSDYNVTIAPFGAMIKKMTWISSSSSTVIDTSSFVTGDIVCFFGVQYDDGTTGVEATTDSTGATLTGVSQYAFLTFGKRLSSGFGTCTQNGPYINFYPNTDNKVSSTIATTYSTVDHSLLLPESRIELIEYGVNDATATASVIASDDGGTSTAFHVGSVTHMVSTDAEFVAWSSVTTSNMRPFRSDRMFKSSSGTVDLYIQQIKLKR